MEMVGLMERHLFDPETGIRVVPPEAVLAMYEANFARFNHILITVDTGERGVDGNLIELTDEQVDERANFAMGIYTQIRESGYDAQVFEQLLESYSDDELSLMLPGFTISEGSGFPENLTRALFEMEIGDVRVVATEVGIHIMKRYALMPPEQTIDLTNPPNTIEHGLRLGFQTIAFFEELAPFMENIVINTEETELFSATTSDTMFDIWGWVVR